MIKQSTDARWYTVDEAGLFLLPSLLYEIPDPKSLQRILTLHPKLQPIAKLHIDLCAKEAGIYIRIAQALRTYAEQDSLYASGRTVPGKKLTNAKGGYSWHNFGLAYDIVILKWSVESKKYVADYSNVSEYRVVAQVGKDLGLEWGGDWKTSKDYPHFQYPMGLTLAQARKIRHIILP